MAPEEAHTRTCSQKCKILSLFQQFEKCKFQKCQFSHNGYENIENNSDESNNEAKEVVISDKTTYEKCAHCNEIVDHEQHNLQECSQCEFASKCWGEYNLHWRKTPDHIFSVDQLRTMGYQL